MRVATAAAPWPVWALIAALAIPGRAGGPSWLLGVLALSTVLALMVLWIHPPPLVQARRWALGVLGTGLLGEVLALALTDLGRGPGLADVPAVARALSVWLICVAIYEVAPVLAAAARLTRSERRSLPLDLLAHGAFAAMAVATHALEPVSRASAAETLWHLSPWMAAFVAATLASARCVPAKDARLPNAGGRAGLLWLLAMVVWLLAAGMLAADASELRLGVWRLRWGARPVQGLLWALPAWSALLCAAAALALALRSRRVRRALHGTVAEIGDGGLTLEREGTDEPLSVILEVADTPARGEAVTLLGVRPQASGVGPFRDGAPGWRARRAFAGRPRQLAASLSRRSAGWMIWAGVSAIGVQVALW